MNLNFIRYLCIQNHAQAILLLSLRFHYLECMRVQSNKSEHYNNTDSMEEMLEKYVEGDYDALRLLALEQMSLKDPTASADLDLNVTGETVETNDDSSSGDEEEVEGGGYEDPSDDEEEEDFLPVIVLDEMFDRLEFGKEGPPDDKVVQALRTYFESEQYDDNTINSYGGFLKCMESIGAKPSAKDPLVFGMMYNVETGEVNDMQKLSEHDAKVRLIRYGELIDTMSAKGIKSGEDWVVQGTYGDSHQEIDRCKENLNLKQIMTFGQVMSYGWYYYTNFDNLFVGRGVGVCKLTPNSKLDGHKDMEMDVDERILLDQCIDIKNRYEVFESPLGPERVFKAEREGRVGRQRRVVSGRGRNNGGGRPQLQTVWGSRPHSKEIISYLSRLLEAIDQYLLPTDATGIFVQHVADMLQSGARYDPAVANALMNKGTSSCGTLVLKLMKRAAEIAEETPSKSDSFRRIWWGASSDLMGALCYSLMCSFKKEAYENVQGMITFFFKVILPELFTGMESSVPQQRSYALENLLVALAAAPRDMLFSFMERKGSWAKIESACRSSLDDCINAVEQQTIDGTKDSSWLNYMKHSAVKKAATLLECLCTRSFESGSMTVSATALTDKMVKRGVIPLLMDIAKADIGHPSNKAMESLGNISRVKDCRTIMLQDESGLALVKSGLMTKDAEMFSSTILLIVHLLWDEEWAEPLSSIEPGVVSTTIRWGLFAMKSIIERAETRKNKRKEMGKKCNDLYWKASRMNDGDLKERTNREAEEVTKKIPENEFNLEMFIDGNPDHVAPLDRLLLRCNLMLQVVNKLEGGYDELIQCGGLSLICSCIDIPIPGTLRAAVVAMRNAFILLGKDIITPSNFNDPACLVRSLFTSSVTALMNKDARFNAIIVKMLGQLKAVSAWAPYFEFNQLPAEYTKSAKNLPLIFGGLSRRPEGIQVRDPISNPVLTGKLRTCTGCGKLEAKRGSFKKCSGCHKAMYCSREVRICMYPLIHS